MDKLRRTLSRFKAERSWQLILLAVTSVILSIASGWTTWIGMQNFTDETILALMITFGIQGVMLVLAWHVGVRLADSGGEANTVFARSSGKRIAPILSRLLEITAVAAIGAIALYLAVRYIFQDHDVVVVPDWPVVQYSATVLAAAAIGVLALRFGYQLTSYFIHAFHFTLRNSVPILMVAVCLTASVFFSFDALFSKIVPQEERNRLADLRSKTDIAAIFNKMQDATTESYRRAAREVLWGKDWLAYEAKLNQVRVAIHGVPEAATAKIEELRKDRLAQQQAHDKVLADLNIAKDEVERRRVRAVARLELARERSSLLRSELTKLSKVVFDIERQIVEKTAEADAEERGIGATSVRGRGPAFRRLSEETERLREEKANAELRRDGYRRRSARSIDVVSELEKEVATLAARIEQFDNRIERQRADPQSTSESISLARVQAQVNKFDADLKASQLRFEQNPSRETLDALQNQCAKGAGFVTSFDLRAEALEGNACSTASLQATAARLFTLNEAKPALARTCVSSNPAVAKATVGERLTFVRECLNLSGLLPSESKSIAADINALERERDDQAHRFVVTYNAFLDGNKLAFLALGIATAVDILVLASGLLGATAIRSSLAGRGLRNDLSASERELMIETALMPEVARNARRAIAEFNPIAKRELGLSSHWTHELVIERAADSSLRSVLRRLMNAGMTIGAVTTAQRGRGVYRVNVSLIEFLIKLARASGAEGQQDQEFFLALERALGDSQAEHATALLQYFLPTNRVAGYTSRIDLPNVLKEDQQAMLRCLNVASSFGYVADTETKDAELDILVSAEVYLALLNMAAAQGQEDDLEVVEDWPQSSGQADVQIRHSSPEPHAQPAPAATVQPTPPPPPPAPPPSGPPPSGPLAVTPQAAAPQAPSRPRNYIGARLDGTEAPQQPAVLRQTRPSPQQRPAPEQQASPRRQSSPLANPAMQQPRQPSANPYAKPTSEPSPGPVAERLRQPKTKKPEEASPPRAGKEEKPTVKITNGTFSFD